jgi:hypothetical protein
VTTEKIISIIKKNYFKALGFCFRKELGMEKDDSESIIEKYQARMQSMNIPVPIREVIDEEMNKLR